MSAGLDHLNEKCFGASVTSQRTVSQPVSVNSDMICELLLEERRTSTFRPDVRAARLFYDQDSILSLTF